MLWISHQEKFPQRIIKDSSYLHREEVSQTENITHKDTKENRARLKRERNIETEKQACRQIKRPNCNRPSQKTDACSLFSLSYLALCSPTPVFKASAGGDTLSSAPWLLYKTSPVYLPSAGITLNTHLSHAARLGKSPLCLCGSITVFMLVCVWDLRGSVSSKVQLCSWISVMSVSFLPALATFICENVLFGIEDILFI